MQKAIYTVGTRMDCCRTCAGVKGTGARFVQMHAERCVDDFPDCIA